MEPTQSGTDESLQSPFDGGSWAFPVLLTILLVVLIGVVLLLAPKPASESSQLSASGVPSAQPSGPSVSLTIEFGNGASTAFAVLPWSAEMTVAGVLEAAREFRPGIEFSQRGTGASGFLTSLEGFGNEGAGGRNWTYQVDGQHAAQSFCLCKVEPNSHILWTFTDQLYNDEPAKE